MSNYQRTPNYKCVVCDKPMYARPGAIEKTKWGLTCSKECGIKNRSLHTSGEQNHQHGLKGENNASFKGDTKTSTFGYVLKYKPDHSRANHAGYVFEHLLVMEEFLQRPLKYFGHKHKDNEVCHHIDRNKQNNSLSNLQLLTESEHSKLHIKEDKERAYKAGKTRALFNEQKCKQIRDEYKNIKITQQKLADKYNTSQSVIYSIINKTRYAYGKEK